MINIDDYNQNLDFTKVRQICLIPEEKCVVVQLNYYGDYQEYLVTDELSYMDGSLKPTPDGLFASPTINQKQAANVQKDIDKIRTDPSLLEKIAILMHSNIR
jgi:carbonic anhydrase